MTLPKPALLLLLFMEYICYVFVHRKKMIRVSILYGYFKNRVKFIVETTNI